MKTPNTLLFLTPHQSADIEHWALLAYTEIACGGFLHATETCAQSASHHVLKRCLAIDAPTLGKTGNSHHHGLRSAGGNLREMAL